MLDTLDGRSDLFSLGMVLLQLLTGRHLLDADARHEAELLSRQLRAKGEGAAGRVPGLEEEMSPTRTTDLMKQMRQLTAQEVEEAVRLAPEGLRAVLLRALAPAREDRYASGAEMAGELRDYLWSSGLRYGRAELVAEVSALSREALEELEEPGEGSKRGKGAPRGRRGGPGKEP